LLVSLVFIFSIVMAMAVPCHLYFRGKDDYAAGSFALTDETFPLWLGVAIAGSLVMGAICTIVPLRIGIKAFRTMEF
jgi:ABC-2 type transport system permease protein